MIGTRRRKERRKKLQPLWWIPLGLLINFGAATFKEDCQRVINGLQSFACVNQGL
jgi:hypothetical protein